MKKYDIIIAGAGASGVFMSYELTKEKNQAKILMIDKGAPLEKRVCPIKAGKTKNCIKCSPCHIMNGYGGAGTLSDGKYNKRPSLEVTYTDMLVLTMLWS